MSYDIDAAERIARERQEETRVKAAIQIKEPVYVSDDRVTDLQRLAAERRAISEAEALAVRNQIMIATELKRVADNKAELERLERERQAAVQEKQAEAVAIAPSPTVSRASVRTRQRLAAERRLELERERAALQRQELEQAAEAARVAEAKRAAAAMDAAELAAAKRLAEKDAIREEEMEGVSPYLPGEEAEHAAHIAAIRDEKFELMAEEKEALLEQGFTEAQIGEVQYGVDVEGYDPFVDLVPPVVPVEEPVVEEPVMVDGVAMMPAEAERRQGRMSIIGAIVFGSLLSFGLAVSRSGKKRRTVRGSPR